MQKLIILDNETGIAHICEVPLDFTGEGGDEDEITTLALCEKLGIEDFNSCQWMLALEISDLSDYKK